MDKVSKSSLKNMSLKDIFREISAIFYETDISNFCDDIKVINRLRQFQSCTFSASG